jgi:hypothetical protein
MRTSSVSEGVRRSRDRYGTGPCRASGFVRPPAPASLRAYERSASRSQRGALCPKVRRG